MHLSALIHSNLFYLSHVLSLPICNYTYLIALPQLFSLHYFFQNGSYYAEGISDRAESTCYQINSKAREIPYAWGCFIVEDGILKIQTYDPGSLNSYIKYKVIEQWAEIVNDTTLHFFKGIDTKGKSSKLDRTFHFRHCENKPDSTNVLMRD